MTLAPSLFDATMSQLTYGLNGLSQRQQLISNNLANIDTPGYLTHDIAFEQQLLQVMNNPLSNAAAPAELPQPYTRNDLQVRNDGNNVDINQQMTELTSTSVSYQAEVNLINSKFTMLTTALAPIN